MTPSIDSVEIFGSISGKIESDRKEKKNKRDSTSKVAHDRHFLMKGEAISLTFFLVPFKYSLY
jgi:hypothetical protein